MDILCLLFNKNLKKKLWKWEAIYKVIFKAGTRLPIGGKIGERIEPRGDLGRRKGGHRWARFARPYFSYLTPFFAFFPLCAAWSQAKLRGSQRRFPPRYVGNTFFRLSRVLFKVLWINVLKDLYKCTLSGAIKSPSVRSSWENLIRFFKIAMVSVSFSQKF